MIAGDEIPKGHPVVIGHDGNVYKLVVSETNESQVEGCGADNLWTPVREAAIKRFIERLETTASEVVMGPVSAMTADGTRFMTLGFGGFQYEGQKPFVVSSTELDENIDGLLDGLSLSLIRQYMTSPTRLVWRKRPELHSDGPVGEAEAVRYGVPMRDYSVVWLRMRLAFEPTGFV